MTKSALKILLVFYLFFLTAGASAEPGKIEEIKQYFELRDTISLVNLEMKRALAPDSRSPMLYESNTEQKINGLMQFLETRIKHFAQSSTPLKYHYVKKLDALFTESRQLYSHLLVKLRTRDAALKPGSLISQGEKNPASASASVEPGKHYFHPVDLRTLLSPALVNTNKIVTEKPKEEHGREEIKNTVTETQKAEIKDFATQAALIATAPREIKIEKTPVAAIPAAKIQSSGEPVKPADAAKPVEPVKPVEKVKPVKPVAPIKPMEPVKPEVKMETAKPAPPVKPVEITRPAETPKHVEPVETVKAPAVAPAGEGFMRPLAIMIENHNKSRPQTALDQADLIYEMPVEGGITRFMAIYTRLPGELGPVRSCREYFIDRALEIDALYVHCGASPVGYAYISKSGINSVDEIKHSKPFHRDNSRKAPHNLYGNGQAIYNYMAEKVSMRLKEKPQLLATGTVNYGSEPGNSLRIRYHGNYFLDIKYEDGAYQRYMNNVLHVDRVTQKPLRFKTFILQVASMKVVDKEGRQEISFIGSGKGWIFDSGNLARVTWHKATPRSRTVYKTSDGKEYLFSGELPVWIQVVSPIHKIYFNGEETEAVVSEKKDSDTASSPAEIGKQG